VAIYTVNGQQIHVHEEKPERDRGPVAILIHGWSSSWFAVKPLLPLLNHRYHCYAIDLPGYGESPRLPHRVTIDDYVELVAEFIRQVSDDAPVVLIGHSMGGMISLTLAMRYPDLVERLVLVCPTISGHLSMFINMFLAPFVLIQRVPILNLLVEVLEPQMFFITDQLLRPALFADQTGLKMEDYVRIRADARRPGQGRIRAECYWAMRHHDLRGKLKQQQIKAPMLVIWGMEDNTVPLRDASIVAAELPEADLRIIPNAGHWPQFETPDLTERYVKSFLSTPLKLLNLEL
jgi:pimeloyl-ACP methyl ester carboxylesterase